MSECDLHIKLPLEGLLFVVCLLLDNFQKFFEANSPIRGTIPRHPSTILSILHAPCSFCVTEEISCMAYRRLSTCQNSFCCVIWLVRVVAYPRISQIRCKVRFTISHGSYVRVWQSVGPTDSGPAFPLDTEMDGTH